MALDGSKVKIGDRVYDLMMGYCTVVSVSRDGSFAIRTKDSTINISKGGFLGRTKRVYWENPVIIVPKKGDRAYRMASSIMKQVYDTLQDNTCGFCERDDDGKDTEEA